MNAYLICAQATGACRQKFTGFPADVESQLEPGEFAFAVIEDDPSVTDATHWIDGGELASRPDTGLPTEHALAHQIPADSPENVFF